MPPRARRGHRVAFRGRFFSTTSARLAPHVRALEAVLADILPELFDGTVVRRLAPHVDPLAGRGVAVAQGPPLPRGTVVGIYFGDFVDSPALPRGDYALGLGRVRRGGHVFHLSVDVSRCCSGHNGAGPDLLNAAMFNHSCSEASVRLGRPPHCPFPCAVAYTTRVLVAGEPLRWNYDGARPSGGFTVDLAESILLRARGVVCVPCACRGDHPCPRGRWFPLDPGP